MHPNPAFRTANRDRNLAFARNRGFGILAINHKTGPLMAHIPFVISKAGDRLGAHLVASNPVWRALDQPCQATLAIAGPDGYVSPDWYGIDDQVPTWNYVAVHIRGSLNRLSQDALAPHLDQLSEQFEQRLAPKPPWTTAKMTPDTLARMQRMIRPVELRIEQIDGTWKLNQNKTAPARLAAAAEIGTSPISQDNHKLAALMADPDGATANDNT